MGRITGRVAIVTGAASPNGFGFATARRFAQEGAKVVLTDISPKVLERAEELESTGFEALGVIHDVTKPESWNDVLTAALNRFGKLDIVVNNAGIADMSDISTTTMAAWDRMIGINLTGVFLGCQTAVNQFRKQGTPGAIVNISSSAALRPHPNNCPYVASKGGVRSMTQSIALDVAAEGIRVNSVHPGMMATDMTAGALKEDPALVEAIIANVPMRKLGEADDIAAMNLFLVSDDAKYITGTLFSVDGGLTAK